MMDAVRVEREIEGDRHTDRKGKRENERERRGGEEIFLKDRKNLLKMALPEDEMALGHIKFVHTK